MFNGLIDLRIDDFFERNPNNTRGHHLKLKVCHARLDVRKYFFCNRVVPIWNALPDNVVEANAIYNFKICIKRVDLSLHCKGRML